jgi:hypothetical protein
MFASIIIDLADAGRATHTKRTFWSTFNDLDVEKKGDDRGPYSRRTADQLEAAFRNRFPQELERQLTDAMRGWWSRRPPIRRWWQFWPAKRQEPLKLSVELIQVGYGSLIGFFDFIGLTGEDGRALLASLLPMYIPPAFQAALGTEVDIESFVSFPTAEGETTPGKSGKSNSLWMAANGLLILPVVFAFLVCYQWSNALQKEFDNAHTDNENLRTERSKIVDGLIDQNAKLSATILDHAKSSVASAKEVQGLLVKLIKEKASRPSSDHECCSKPDQGKAKPDGSLSTGNNYNICMLSAEAPQPNRSLRLRAGGRFRKQDQSCPLMPR